jgi:peptide/nickel transport system permease protein
LRQPRARIGLGFVALVVLVAIFGPLAAPHNPTAIVGIPISGPSSAFPLGLDYLGRDVLSRVLWGGRSVVWMSFAAATLCVSLGALVGMLAGYSRSALDDVLMRALDVLLAFPQVVLVLLFVSMLGPKTWLIVLMIALAWVPQVARVARGVTSEVVYREYIEAADAMGLSRTKILLREVLPNVATPLTVEYGLRLTWSIAIVAAVSFLGFGIQPPNADWGLMISENRGALTVQPWPVLVPCLLIAMFAIGTNFLTESVSRAVARTDR